MSIQLNANIATSSFGQGAAPSSPPPPPSLSAEQKSAAESILSEYSASDLTEEDAQSIVEAFKEEGIQPSKDLKDTLEAAGFDAKELAELAGLPPREEGNQGPPPPQQGGSNSSGVNQENLQALQAILDQYSELSELTSEDEHNLANSLLAAGLFESGSIINTQT